MSSSRPTLRGDAVVAALRRWVPAVTYAHYSLDPGKRVTDRLSHSQTGAVRLQIIFCR
ncbi:MAG: hypothetical protein GY703_17090 [Gammaproteobacteria bacterium]|nr:hypothetical protein [Gammaproteobacteria bacterium]